MPCEPFPSWSCSSTGQTAQAVEIVPEFASDPQRLHRITLSVGNVEDLPAVVDTFLRIETDHPRRPVVRVPLYALAERLAGGP